MIPSTEQKVVRINLNAFVCIWLKDRKNTGKKKQRGRKNMVFRDSVFPVIRESDHSRTILRVTVDDRAR